MDRQARLAQIEGCLGGRALVFAGIRGSDAESLADLEQLQAVFSIIDALGRSTLDVVSYEDLTGERVDLERWDIDDHLDDEATAAFRRGLLSALNSPSALVPYRASRFLSAMAFARRDRSWYLGVHGALQQAFDHKPWVETSLGERGVPCIDWRYIADEDRDEAYRMLDAGPLVLRPSRTSGGEGIQLVTEHGELDECWPDAPEGFVSVSRYLADAVSLNIGGVVWEDTVTTYHPSVQLVGLPSCTSRFFGYCGNDFGASRVLDDSMLNELERLTISIGDWLRTNGYLGAFGVDFLLDDDRLLFTEVNPRFQGSTAPSARLSVEAGEPCIVLDHVAAHLRLAPGRGIPLAERAATMADLAHVVLHRIAGRRPPKHAGPILSNIRAHDPTATIELIPPRRTTVHDGAIVARILTRSRVTESGRSVSDHIARAIASYEYVTSVKDPGT